MTQSTNFLHPQYLVPKDSVSVSSKNPESIPPSTPNTVRSTVASSIATRDSAFTSIPSEAPAPQHIATADSSSIAHLIDDTFVTSATANRGGDAALDKPYRRHARCSAQHPPETPCTECQAIENDIKLDEEKQQTPSQMTSPIENAKENNLNVCVKPMESQIATIVDKNDWHMSNTPDIDKMSEFNLTPIATCTTQASDSISTVNHTIKPLLDNTSFIVLNDENENTTRYPIEDAFNRPCDDCCFCNPNLHHRKKQLDANEEQLSSRKCNFCISSRQQSTQTTPAPCNRTHRKLNTPSNDSNYTGRTSTAPTEHIFESKSRSTHSHIRRQAKDSDAINTICTRKLNRTTRKTSHLINNNGNDAEPNEPNKMHGKNEELHDLNGNKAKGHKKSTVPKLPPTTNHECWHSNSNDTFTSSPSSSSNESSSKMQRRRNSKSVPNLPKGERWPNAELKIPTKPHSRTNSRYQEFHAESNRTVATNSSANKTKPTGK